jgi:neuronal guanine nucleotide exchange factor
MDLLHNHGGKQPSLFFNFSSENERQRWVEAIEPPKSKNPNEKVYEDWDCPQVICRRPYTALQPDELTLQEADTINVLRKQNDWYEGERLSDGARGWFPSDSTEEVVNKHVRARNLKQRHRLMALLQSYIQQQQLHLQRKNSLN